jgi:hypothetical protein
MATGYGTHSETTYAAHTDNMAVAESGWIRELLSEQPDLQEMTPAQWGNLQYWGDHHNQITNGFRLAGMTENNTDHGYLYGKITVAAGLVIYKDADMLNSVGQVAAGATTFTELNDSGLFAASTWSYSLAAVPSAETKITFRMTTLPIELDRIRSQVADRIITMLVSRSDTPVKKAEYLKRLHDKTELEKAEVYCGLMIFFSKQRDGDRDDATSTMEQLYRELLGRELSKPLSWDLSVFVEEDEPTVRASVGSAQITVDFL